MPYSSSPWIPVYLAAASTSLDCSAPASGAAPMRRVFTSRSLAELSPWSGLMRRSKSCCPWVKNGRFSSKNVSMAEKFTTRLSLSTWPKSGFTAADSWLRPLGFQNTSKPARPLDTPLRVSCENETYGYQSSDEVG